jgi:hypothetical protein
MASVAVTSIAGGDGNIFNDNGGTWATVKALTTGTAQATSDPVNVYAAVFSSRSLARIFLPFDTSSIPTGSTIISAVLQFTVTAILTSNSTLHVVQSTQADGSSLVGNDFDNIPNSTGALTTGGSVSVTTTGVKSITLNATALGWITPGGTTKLALVEDHDVSNTDPSPGDFRFSVNMAENATPANRPILTISFSLGGLLAGEI